MREHIYAVYVMANARRGVLYIGVTSDLPSRGLQHRDGTIEGFTRRYGCKSLVWFELHGDIRDAIDREKRVKRWRRDWKFRLVEAANPDWIDLWPALMGQARYPWEDAADFQAPGDPGSAPRFGWDDR
jgi:putative endonuclease